jgi:hypothetical protein
MSAVLASIFFKTQRRRGSRNRQLHSSHDGQCVEQETAIQYWRVERQFVGDLRSWGGRRPLSDIRLQKFIAQKLTVKSGHPATPNW